MKQAKPRTTVSELAKQAGVFTCAEVAEYVNSYPQLLYYYQRLGLIDWPKTRIPGFRRMFYSPQERDEIAKFFGVEIK
jgi:hypothetical protein